ncbi:cysteine hydrolase family protein [Caenimonas aquaedulcis]|uniref:cysteine hydrolase family protein n=1 Tax=Caenimonas aquaedulcis TaxID=2793270 RepID=UPI0018C90FD6|nr:cysteine hydrolase family protein [Caenimonas aquaedulcis]
MSKFPDRPRSALLVIDVQNDVVATAWMRTQVISNIAELVRKARAAGTPVVWVQHSDDWLPAGSEPWQIVPELQPLPGEPRIGKHFRSSFEETTLDALLEELRVGRLFICGAQTNFCVRHTTHAAIERGYDVTLVADAHTTSDEPWQSRVIPAASIVDELNRACMDYRLPYRSSGLVTTADADFA